MTKLRVGSATDVGLIRSSNQDSSLVLERVVVVADGMGGHAGGEVASEVAVSTIEGRIGEVAPSQTTLIDAIEEANRAILERAGADPDLHGMGTTVTAIALVGDGETEQMVVANVGDSRVYRHRDGELTQLTEDHSLVEELVREGRLSPEEAEIHPQRNILTRVLGSEADVRVDTDTYEVVDQDRYLLCSDGLFNEVAPPRIQATLQKLADPQEAAEELVRLALEGGGRDNITVAVVDVVGAHTPAGAAPAAAPDGATETGIAQAAGAEEADGDDAPRPRRFTLRTAAFVLAVLVVFGTAAFLVGIFARGTYFVGFADDEVAIFKGRPGGVLWFDPTLEERTGIDREDVPSSFLPAVTDGKDASNLDDARAYVTRMQEKIDEEGGIVRDPSGEIQAVDLPLPPIGARAETSTCPEPGETERVTEFPTPPPTCIAPGADLLAVVTTSLGSFTVDLDETRAAELVNNFVFLAGWNTYDRVAFHHVEDDLLRTGDPVGPRLGEGEPGYTLLGELEGSISRGWNLVQDLAVEDRSRLSGSRFSLVRVDEPTETTPSGFGRVVDGEEVIERIVENAGGRTDGAPTLEVRITEIEITTAAERSAQTEA